MMGYFRVVAQYSGLPGHNNGLYRTLCTHWGPGDSVMGMGRFQLYYNPGPADHIHIRISHSGSKAPEVVWRILMFMWSLGGPIPSTTQHVEGTTNDGSQTYLFAPAVRGGGMKLGGDAGFRFFSRPLV